jgi:hypothetical protein
MTGDETDSGNEATDENVAESHDRPDDSKQKDEQEDTAGMHGEASTRADTGESSVALNALVDRSETDPETTTGTFYVKHATDSSVTLHDVDTAQILTLAENPGVESHEIIEATLVAQPPMEVAYLVDEMTGQYSVPVETSPEPPTRQVRETAAEMDETQAATIEREGEGEIHVLRVPPEDVDQTATEVGDDEMTYKNAARCGIDRVEIRTDETGIVSVRYLP